MTVKYPSNREVVGSVHISRYASVLGYASFSDNRPLPFANY